MILPGCESLNGEVSVAWCCARKDSTPRASAGIEPQHLQRGDDAVAAERRREPGDAGIGVGAGRQLGGQQRDVGAGPRQPVVEDAARAVTRWRRAGAWRASPSGRAPPPPGTARGSGAASLSAPTSMKSDSLPRFGNRDQEIGAVGEAAASGACEKAIVERARPARPARHSAGCTLSLARFGVIGRPRLLRVEPRTSNMSRKSAAKSQRQRAPTVSCSP